jgi:hypothetical protein
MDTEIRLCNAGTLFQRNGRRLASRLVWEISHAKLVDSHGAFVFYHIPRLYLHPKRRHREV